MSCCCLGAKESAQSKISEFDNALRCYKNVGWFDVPVHNTSGMHVVEGATDLNKIFPDGLLWDETILLLEVLDK